MCVVLQIVQVRDTLRRILSQPPTGYNTVDSSVSLLPPIAPIQTQLLQRFMFINSIIDQKKPECLTALGFFFIHVFVIVNLYLRKAQLFHRAG